MSNHKRKQEQENNFKIFVIDAIERNGIDFHVSSNNYDGSVFIIAKSDAHSYFRVKCFSNTKSARKWCDDLVNSSTIVDKLA